MNAAAPALESALRQNLLRPLARLRQRCRLYLAIQGLRWLLAAMLATGLVQLGLDRTFHLAVDQRAVLNVLITLVWLWVAIRRLLLPLLAPLPLTALARLVDRAHPELHDQLATAVELTRPRAPRPRRDSPEPSPALVAHVVAQACRAAGGVPFLDVLDHRRAGARLAQVFAGLLLIALAVHQMPDTLGTWFARNWLLQDLPWPQRTYIWPDQFGADARRRLARGDLVEITASVRGRVPDDAVLEWWTDSGLRGREAMSIIGDAGLFAALGQLSENVHFRIAGGDERTREFTIEAVERPRIIHSVARIHPPAYTGLDPLEIEQQTVLELVQGAALDFTATLNKPVRTARFVAADGTAAPGELAWTPREAAVPRVALHWPEPASGSFRFELVDYDGLSSQNPVRYTLRIVPDRPPRVQLTLAGVGEYVTPQAELPAELTCEDTYGLGAVALLVQAGEQSAEGVALDRFSPGDRHFRAQVLVPVAGSGSGPGGLLRLWGQAADLDPRGPNAAQTPVTTLRVVSPDAFLAELARRELLLRQEFERLRSVQRGLKETLARLAPELPAEALPPEPLLPRLAALARSQSEQAGRSLTLARGFEQILTEMQISKVARAADERRITTGVVDPLRTLAGQTIPAAADALAALRRSARPGQREQAQALLDAVLQQMDAILANMLEWEGYREAVALLESVIAAQAEVRSQTLERIEQQLRDILGPDEPAP